MYNSGEFSANLANGSFKNIFPGCYIKKTKTIDSITYTDHIDIIVSLDPYYGKFDGSAILKTHHVGIVPYEPLGTSYMNSTNSVTGGYYSSYMRNTTLPKYLTGYKNAYGSSHFLTFGELISTDVNTSQLSPATPYNGVSSNWDWFSTQITLMSEVQVYGSSIWGGGYDTGEACTQLEAFQFNHALQNFTNCIFWLRGVAYSTAFTRSNDNGSASAAHAGTSYYYVRPLLLLY